MSTRPKDLATIYFYYFRVFTSLSGLILQVTFCWEYQAEVKICHFLGVIGCVEKFPLVDFQALFSHLKTWIYMELWWNLDIYDGIWTFHDGIWTFYDGKLTNWPCWSEGKVGTEPFTWLGQGFHFNFSEIPFQKRENLSIYGQNYGQLRSNGDFWRSCNRKKKGFTDTPVFCNASRNKEVLNEQVLDWWILSFTIVRRLGDQEKGCLGPEYGSRDERGSNLDDGRMAWRGRHTHHRQDFPTSRILTSCLPSTNMGLSGCVQTDLGPHTSTELFADTDSFTRLCVSSAHSVSHTGVCVRILWTSAQNAEFLILLSCLLCRRIH